MKQSWSLNVLRKQVSFLLQALHYTSERQSSVSVRLVTHMHSNVEDVREQI